MRSEEHTSELQSRVDLVCRLLLPPKETYRSGVHYRLIKKDGSFGVKELAMHSGNNPKVERKLKHV